MLSISTIIRSLVALGFAVPWACQRANPPSTRTPSSRAGDLRARQASPHDTALAASGGASSQAPPQRGFRPCVAEKDCEPGTTCVSVDEQPAAKACASLAPPVLAAGTPIDIQPKDMNRLFVFRKHKISRLGARCTLLACARPDGTPVECCNRCSDILALSGFPYIPIFAPTLKPVGCASRLDCEPSSCPEWLELGIERDIVGSFQITGYGLSFVLANGPPAATSQPSARNASAR